MGTTNKVRASLAQAFNGRGDALVLQGEEFPWEPSRRDRSPHLDGERAQKLVELVLKRYVRETRGDGFKAGLKEVREYDLVALGETDVRFLREGNYPVLRGTHFSVGKLDYLYTTGFIPCLNTFPHGHVPLPVQIADHHGGDRPVRELLQEMLVLTKMNWNSANFCSRWPITLGSSRLVGEILREIPSGKEPEANFKYYV